MPSLVKAADLAALDVTLRTGFMGAYDNPSYTERWPIFATRQMSAGRANIYPQMIDAAQIREWVEGERVVNGLVLVGATVTNQKFELTYGLRRTDVDDDLTGAVAQALSRMRSGANKYKRHPDKLVMGVVRGNTTCLDGLALFHATHKLDPSNPDSATFSNTDSGALSANNVAAARAAMLELKLPDGDPANEDPNILLVPPALELTARKIAQADVIVFSGSANESNVMRGKYTVVVEPRLAASTSGGSDTAWYLVDATDPEDRAVIYQEREAVEIVSQFNPADPTVFNLDMYSWGTRCRRTVYGGNPKKIQRRTG